MVQLVAAAYRAISGQQGQAGQSEIADNVEHLVADAFVAVAQPFGIEQAAFVEHHRILKRGAERKTRAPESRDIAHAAKSPRPADFAAEPFGAELEGVALTADHGVGKVDFDFGAEPGSVGPQFTEGVAHRDLHWL